MLVECRYLTVFLWLAGDEDFSSYVNKARIKYQKYSGVGSSRSPEKVHSVHKLDADFFTAGRLETETLPSGKRSFFVHHLLFLVSSCVG